MNDDVAMTAAGLVPDHCQKDRTTTKLVQAEPGEGIAMGMRLPLALEGIIAATRLQATVDVIPPPKRPSHRARD